MKLLKTKSILVIVVKWWDLGLSTPLARSVFQWQWIWFQCQRQQIRTCFGFHLLPLQNLPLAKRNWCRSVSYTPCLMILFFLCLSCFSAIGRQGGKQRISVGEGCEFKGTVMHEMMHALGFFHEQSRTDRDDYVMVLWWNVEPGTYYEWRPGQNVWGITWPNTETLITKTVK